jgi:hypothetical protein
MDTDTEVDMDTQVDMDMVDMVDIVVDMVMINIFFLFQIEL